MGERMFEDEASQRMWDNLNSDEFAKELVLPTKRKKRNAVDPKLSDLVSIRIELRKMIQNSKWVVAEAAKDIEQFTKEEKYFCANQSKVAHLIHTNFIERMQKILQGKAAFDYEIELDDEDEPPDSGPVIHLK
jgi:hypothetical protein